MKKLIVFSTVLLLAALAQAQPAPQFACRWAAELTAARAGVSDSYQVPFTLLIEAGEGGLRATLVNGSDKIPFSSAVQQGRELAMRLEQYDATLTMRCASEKCDKLEGEYVRQRGTKASRYAVSATCAPQAAMPVSTNEPMASDWLFTFTDASGKPAAEPTAPAHFVVSGSHIEGTIALLSGDYGMLSGEITGGGTEMVSRFDGVHALRLEGHQVGPGRVEGVLHEAPGVALDFVATPASATEGFAEAESKTTVADPAVPFHFHGIDATGAEVSEQDARFRGKVVLVDLFGTWCPNCHDEAPVLAEMYARYHARGLEIVGLSYEYTDDRAHDLHLIDVYRRKYNIPFTVLLAGTLDEGQMAKTLPQLRDFGAFPTTLFLDRHGRVKLIHAGFSGPATGRLDELKQHFAQEIEKLLAEQ